MKGIYDFIRKPDKTIDRVYRSANRWIKSTYACRKRSAVSFRDETTAFLAGGVVQVKHIFSLLLWPQSGPISTQEVCRDLEQ